MKQQLYDALSENPIIMAIKDDEGFQASLRRSGNDRGHYRAAQGGR